eukprot:gene4861-biopygen7037
MWGGPSRKLPHDGLFCLYSLVDSHPRLQCRVRSHRRPQEWTFNSGGCHTGALNRAWFRRARVPPPPIAYTSIRVIGSGLWAVGGAGPPAAGRRGKPHICN